MASIVDDRGYNQGFKDTQALRVRTARRIKMIGDQLRLATLTSDDTVMEIGCGTGEFAAGIAQLTSAQVLGTDLCHPFIRQASEQHASLSNLKFEALNFKEPVEVKSLLPQKDLKAIYGNGILHHLYYDIDNSLARIRDLLAPGGRIAFIEPNLFNPYVFLIFSFAPLRRIARLEPDEMAFSKHFIEKKMLQAGFTNVRADYVDFLLPNTPYFLIEPLSRASDVLDKWPLTRWLAQSILIQGQRS